MQLDTVDFRILYELERDSSQPLTAIAKRLRRSREVVAYRIQRLQEERILLSCAAIVDMAKLGYFTFRVYIRWRDMISTEKQEFWERLRVDERIWTIAILHGKWDLAFFIGLRTAESIQGFHEIWAEILGKYKGNIADSRIALYSPVHNFNKVFFVQGSFERLQRSYGSGLVVAHDDVDEKIIAEYAHNVRVPLAVVAKAVGLSIEGVRQRIKRLEHLKVIAGYKIDLDLEKMGWQGYRVDFMLRSTARNKELFEYLKQHKYFYQINQSIGGADFEAEVVVRDLPHLLEILEEIVQRFKDTISQYEYMGYSNFAKLSIVPD
jgi:Lrp/AsnC family leucine-responsive transcriptional regulator